MAVRPSEPGHFERSLSPASTAERVRLNRLWKQTVKSFLIVKISDWIEGIETKTGVIKVSSFSTQTSGRRTRFSVLQACPSLPYSSFLPREFGSTFSSGHFLSSWDSVPLWAKSQNCRSLIRNQSYQSCYNLHFTLCEKQSLLQSHYLLVIKGFALLPSDAGN